MAGEVAVIGIGMVSAVGLSAAEVAASVRSGVMRFEETRMVDKTFEPITVASVPVEELPPSGETAAEQRLEERARRLLRLAAPPLEEVLEGLPEGTRPPPLFLSLPEASDPDFLVDGVGFLDLLAAGASGFDRRASEVVGRGRAGGLQAIDRAAERLRDGTPFVLVGGIDSYCDPALLKELDMQGRLKSDANLDGFIPGEGAAFLALATTETASASGVPVLARLSPVGQAHEPGHLGSEQPYRGDGLAEAVGRALAGGFDAGPVREVYSSMNGESHWAKEWAVAFLRHRGAFAEEHGMHHPAECHGDVGAAAGTLLVGLAAVGIADGYRGSPCLVYASSDAGDRSALLVQAG